MATLKDVAALANVDVSTVSRALNNTSYVHPDTKAKIVAAAKELGYHPNVIAKALRQGKRHAIGYVVPRLHMTLFSEILQGIDEEARSRGYSVSVCITGDDPEQEKKCLTQLRDSGIDGIIITTTGKNLRLMRDIHASGIAMVQLMRKQDPQISSVVADTEACGYDGTHYLSSTGSHLIGLVNGPSRLGPYIGRLHGYQKAIRESGQEEVTATSDRMTNTFEFGYECAVRMMEEYPDLDAIMAAVDIQGLGAMRAVKDAGKRIPEDIRVMSLTGHSVGSMLETTMTAMEIPAQEMGRAATDMLIREIEASADRKPSPHHLSFPASLVEREST